MNKLIDERMNEWVSKWIFKWMGGRKNRLMNGFTAE